jgi:hypothetical protein
VAAKEQGLDGLNLWVGYVDPRSQTSIVASFKLSCV